MTVISKPLAGRSALVTGSTSGIGLGIARGLAAAGANITLNGFGDAAAIESLRAELAAEAGVSVAYDGADVTDADAVQRMADAAIARNGLDILINNAGIQHVDPLERFPVERWQAVIATNLSAAFYGTRAIVSHMKAKGWGRIINIASAHGRVASANKAAYVAAKHGVVGLTKVTALETAGTGVTCNAICPGWVLTPLVQKQIDANAASKGITVEAAKAELVNEKQPSHEFVTPEQIAGLTLFLCSDAAAQMTGAALSMDGGWTAQ